MKVAYCVAITLALVVLPFHAQAQEVKCYLITKAETYYNDSGAFYRGTYKVVSLDKDGLLEISNYPFNFFVHDVKIKVTVPEEINYEPCLLFPPLNTKKKNTMWSSKMRRTEHFCFSSFFVL